VPWRLRCSGVRLATAAAVMRWLAVGMVEVGQDRSRFAVRAGCQVGRRWHVLLDTPMAK
jgi:hypothetical protein